MSDGGVRNLWRRLNQLPDGWWGVATAVAICFVTGALFGLFVLDHEPVRALSTAGGLAVGGGLGQRLRMRWLKRPAWPVDALPPPRAD